MKKLTLLIVLMCLVLPASIVKADPVTINELTKMDLISLNKQVQELDRLKGHVIKLMQTVVMMAQRYEDCEDCDISDDFSILIPKPCIGPCIDLGE